MHRDQIAPTVQRQVTSLDSAWPPLCRVATAMILGGLALVVLSMFSSQPSTVDSKGEQLAAAAPPLWRTANALTVCPDDQTIVLGWSDGRFAELDSAAGCDVRWTKLNDHAFGIDLATALSRDGRTWLAGCAEGSVHIRRHGRRSRAIVDGAITSVACSADGQAVAAGGTRTVVVWDTDSLRPLLKLRVLPSAVRCITISDDARRIAVILADDQVQVWDVPSSMIVRTWRADYHISIARLSPDGCHLASGDQCGGLHIDEIPTGRTVVDDRPTGGSLDAIVAMDFSPDGRLLACGRDQGRVQLWNIATGVPAGELTGHTGPVSALCFPATGTKLVSTGSDAMFRTWGLDVQRELERLRLRQILPSRYER